MKSDHPNVVFVLTDDQGYGDLSCHGNPVVKTPHIDALHACSVRLTDYHVGPTCAPTRAGLLTGHYANSTGVWRTSGGRSLLRANEISMADFFRRSGYATGIFGKWHLGDNTPYRPQDRGFETVVVHGGGGVGQTPDYWGNNYFDDSYWDGERYTRYDGYCTDVWFQQALNFIERNRQTPFFCYIPTNAPHSPSSGRSALQRSLPAADAPPGSRQLLRDVVQHRRKRGRAAPPIGRVGIGGEHDLHLHD